MPTAVPLVRRRTTPQARTLTTALVAVAFTAGCGTGFGAQTQQIYNPAVGVTVRTGDVYVLNALFVANTDSTATLSVSLLDRSGEGDQLVSVEVTTGEGEPIEVTQKVQPFELCAGQLAVLGSNAVVTIAGDNFAAGDTVELALAFRDAEPVRAHVPVVARGDSGTYDSVVESPDAAASPEQPCQSASLTPTPAPSS